MPENIQHYEVLSRLATGATGTVHRGRNAETQQEVAIKILHDEFARDQKLRKRLFNEAKTLRQLKHPNIVQVFDIVEQQGNVLIIMEYVPGKSLSTMAGRKSRAYSVDIALPLIAQTLKAVIAAHSKKTFHGHLKPADVLLLPDTTIKVGGLGLFSALGATTVLRNAGRGGSLPYMPPEQAKADPIDERADVYSVGMMMFQLLTGVLPFASEAASEMSIRNAIINTPLPEPGVLESLPEGLVEILRKALAKDRVLRPTAREFYRQLQRFAPEQQTQPIIVPVPVAGVGDGIGAAGKIPVSPTSPFRPESGSAPTSPFKQKTIVERRLEDLRSEQDRQRISVAAKASGSTSSVVPAAAPPASQYSTPQLPPPLPGEQPQILPFQQKNSFSDDLPPSQSPVPVGASEQAPEKKNYKRYAVIAGLLTAGSVATYYGYKVWQDKPWQAKPVTSKPAQSDSVENRINRIDSLMSVPEVHADPEDTTEPGATKQQQTGTANSTETPTLPEKTTPTALSDEERRKKLPSVLANYPKEKKNVVPSATGNKITPETRSREDKSQKSLPKTEPRGAITPAASTPDNRKTQQRSEKPVPQQQTLPAKTSPAQQQSKLPTIYLPDNVQKQSAKQRRQEQARQRRQELQEQQRVKKEQARQRLQEKRQAAFANKAKKEDIQKPSATPEKQVSGATPKPARKKAKSLPQKKSKRGVSSDDGFFPREEKQPEPPKDSPFQKPAAEPAQELSNPAASVMTLRGHLSNVLAVAFSPDGKLLASGGSDKTVKIWDPQTGKIIRSLRGHNKSVTAVFFSPDGKLIMSGSSDKTIKVWNIETGERLQSTPGISCTSSPVAFSPDGKFIASVKQKNIVLSKAETTADKKSVKQD